MTTPNRDGPAGTLAALLGRAPASADGGHDHGMLRDATLAAHARLDAHDARLDALEAGRPSDTADADGPGDDGE